MNWKVYFGYWRRKAYFPCGSTIRRKLMTSANLSENNCGLRKVQKVCGRGEIFRGLYILCALANRSNIQEERSRAIRLGATFDATLLVFSERLSTKYLDCPKAIFNINLPCGVGSNQNVGDFSDLIFPVSTRKIICPPSM